MIRMYARSFLWGREMWVREYKKSVKWPSTAFSLFLMSCPNNTRSLLAHTYQISAEYIAIWQIANLIVLKKSIAEYSSIIDISMCHHYYYTYVYDLALSYLWICYYSCIIDAMNYIEKVVDLFINRLFLFSIYI
jgi:hypothetical protein